MAKLDIRGTHRSWAVFDGDHKLAETTHYDTACAVANRIERELDARTRECLCCGAAFTSAGRGNRLCDECLTGPPVCPGARVDRKPVSLVPLPWVNPNHSACARSGSALRSFQTKPSRGR